jgi:hypothetical protein
VDGLHRHDSRWQARKVSEKAEDPRTDQALSEPTYAPKQCYPPTSSGQRPKDSFIILILFQQT